MRRAGSTGWLALCCLLATNVVAQDADAPRAGQFPPRDKAVYLSGELVLVDPINRRGALRIDADGADALAVKELARSLEDAVPGRFLGFGHSTEYTDQ